MALDIVGPANAPNAVTSRPADTRTFGAADTWVQDCSSPSANDGTKVQAGFVNALIGQFRNLIRGNGQTAAAADIVTQNNTDDSMALKALQHLIQRGLMNYAADTGAADVLVVTLAPALAEYKAGTTPIRVKKSNAANATTTPTINVNGLGAVTIVAADGTALEVGELPANSYFAVQHDGTNFRLISSARPATTAEVEAGALFHKFVSPLTLIQRRTPYFILNQSGSGTIANGVNAIQPLTVDAGKYLNDAASNLNSTNTYAFTCGPKDAGVWLFIGVFGMSVPGSTQINVAIAKNGGTPTPYQAINVSGTANTHMAYAVRMAAGDYVQLSAFQNSGSTQTTSAGQIIGLRLSA